MMTSLLWVRTMFLICWITIFIPFVRSFCSSYYYHYYYSPTHHHVTVEPPVSTQLYSIDHLNNKHGYEFHIAPMQCYTNLALRKLFSLLSPSSILWTEMEKVSDILQPNQSNDHHSLVNVWSKRLGSPKNTNNDRNNDENEQSKLILQLGCSDAAMLKTCVSQTLSDYNRLKGINLNCGCPSIESGGASNYGAKLMKDTHLTGELVHVMKEAVMEQGLSSSISVKCRIGIIDSFDDIRPLNQENDYEYLNQYISTIKDAGADHVILHARPAILSGLSPVKNRLVPELNYDIVERIASDFSDLRITLNGGIVGLDQYNTMIERMSKSHISSHMAGRWCLRRPLDLIGIESMLMEGSMVRISIVKAIDEYIEFAIQSILSGQNQISVADLCLPLYLVSEQLKEDYSYEHDSEDVSSIKPILSIDEIEEASNVLSRGVKEISSLSNGKRETHYYDSNDVVNFRKLSKSLKSIVGSKVVNKWSRNRAEL